MAWAAHQLLHAVAQLDGLVGMSLEKLLVQVAAVLPQVDQCTQLTQAAVDGQRVMRMGIAQPGFQLQTALTQLFGRGLAIRSLNPGVYPGQVFLQLRQQAIRFPLQSMQCIGGGDQLRHQHRHACPELAGMNGREIAAAVVRQVRDHAVEPHHVHQQCVQRVLVRLTQVMRIEHATDGGPAIVQQQPHLLAQHRGDPAGKQHGIDQAGADDAQQDLFRAGERDVEDGRRMVDLGQADQRHRIGREQEDVAARRAIAQRQIEQGADPDGNRQAEHHRLLGEHRQKDHRRRRAQQGAKGAVDRLRPGGAGQGMRDNVHRGHGPVRVVQRYREGEIERKQGGNQRFGGKQPFTPARHVHG